MFLARCLSRRNILIIQRLSGTLGAGFRSTGGKARSLGKRTFVVSSPRNVARGLVGSCVITIKRQRERAGAPSKLKLFGCLLNPSHEKQNDKDDQDDADESDATMTIPVPIAAEAATESTEQEDYENDNEDETERHVGVLSFQRCGRSRRRTPGGMWHMRDFHPSLSVRTL
jgi:hypothetical protein